MDPSSCTNTLRGMYTRNRHTHVSSTITPQCMRLGLTTSSHWANQDGRWNLNHLTTADRVRLVAVAVNATTRMCVCRRLIKYWIRQNVILNSLVLWSGGYGDQNSLLTTYFDVIEPTALWPYETRTRLDFSHHAFQYEYKMDTNIQASHVGRHYMYD